MQKNLSSWLLRFSLALVPVAIGGCAAGEGDLAAMREIATRGLLGASSGESERAEDEQARHGPYATIMVGACEAGSTIRHCVASTAAA